MEAYMDRNVVRKILQIHGAPHISEFFILEYTTRLHGRTAGVESIGKQIKCIIMQKVIILILPSFFMQKQQLKGKKELLLSTMMYVNPSFSPLLKMSSLFTEYLNISLNAIEIVENLAGCENLKKLGERTCPRLTCQYLHMFQSSSAKNLGKLLNALKTQITGNSNENLILGEIATPHGW